MNIKVNQVCKLTTMHLGNMCTPFHSSYVYHALGLKKSLILTFYFENKIIYINIQHMFHNELTTWSREYDNCSDGQEISSPVYKPMLHYQER
jgi:hypothetical protein